MFSPKIRFAVHVHEATPVTSLRCHANFGGMNPDEALGLLRN